MFHQESKQMLVGIFVALLSVAVPAHAVTSFKVSNYGGGHQIWFEAEAFDERNPESDQYFPVVDQAGAFGKAITRAGGAGGMIRWTFDISLAGGSGGTWYFWGRVINPSNQSDFMIVEGDPGDPPVPSGPPFPGTSSAAQFSNADRIFEQNAGSPGNWAWSRADHAEAHTKQLRSGENSMYIFHRQGNNTIFWDVFVWTDDPAYVPTDADYQSAAPPALGKASNPRPADGATDVPREAILSWTPGKYAPAVNGHRVFLSSVLAEVDDGTVGVTQNAGSYAPPQRLAFETTYYWRVDEVNAPPDSTVHKGNVWSFTTEPFAYPVGNITATASSSSDAGKGPENTANGSGLDGNGLHSTNETQMWLSGPEANGAWIQYEFDKVYKLHQMQVWNHNTALESVIGFGIKEATIEHSLNGSDWTALGGTHEFARAPATAGYAHNTTVDFGGVTAKDVRLTAISNWGGLLKQYGLSEVRFLHIPVHARQPNPASGATDVDPEAVLTWRAGREAARHDVSLSTDEQAVMDGTAPVVTVTGASYGSTLDLGATYYWRVDEVNDAEMPTTWQGDLWSFSTVEFLVVDDFESYNDVDPPDPESNRIFESWVDGFGVAANGALVGNDLPPYAERAIVHGGGQSMPLFYSNTSGAAFSEAVRTFAPAQDWTRHAVKTLGLWFHGAAGNTGQLYVKINGLKVPYDGDPGNLAGGAWQPWNIDLSALGVNLQSVTTLTVGIDGNGAAGTLYFDDVRLYAYARQLISPAPPDPAGLVVHYELEGNANDSTGTAPGTVSGAIFVAGKFGQAISLDGNDYVDCGNPSPLDFSTGDWTVSAWVNGPSSLNQMNVFGKGGDNAGGIRYVLAVGEVDDHVTTLTVDDNVTKAQSIGSVIADDGQWHHIVGLRDGNSLRIYVDGFQDGTTATLPAGYNLSGTSQANAYIGAGLNFETKALQKFFTGVIDDVRVYNYALSSAEIHSLRGATLPFDAPF